MSLIARLGIGLLIGLVVLFSYIYFAEKKAERESADNRLQNFYKKSLSNPNETIIELKNTLKEGELSEEEWLLLFELLTESALHSHLHYIDYFEDKKSQNPSVDWQITDACISYRDGNASNALILLQQLVREHPAHRRANYEYHRIQFLIGSVDDRIASKLALRELSQEETDGHINLYVYLHLVLKDPGY